MSENEKNGDNCNRNCWSSIGGKVCSCRQWQPIPSATPHPEEKKCEYCGSWSCDGCIGSLRHELAEAKATITAMHCAMAEKDKEIVNLKTTLDAAQNLTVEAISAYAGKVAMS